MNILIKFLKLKIFFIFNYYFLSFFFADNHNIYETLEQIQRDLKTLEKAVYSNSSDFNDIYK